VKSVCFDLADRGMLRFDDDVGRVGLVSPQVLIDLVDGDNIVTIEEIVALRANGVGRF
jgi:hypothetical protein